MQPFPTSYASSVLPSYGAGSYTPYAPSIVPTVPPMYPQHGMYPQHEMYPQHFAGGSYGASMYSPDDDYYHSSRGGSYYGRPNYLGGGSYMGDYDYGYDDDYYGYGDSYYPDRHYDRYHDPYHHSSRSRRYPYYGRGRHHYDSYAYASYYAPKAYQITNDGDIKTLRYGHEHFKDKMRRICGMDPRGLKSHRH